MANFDRNNRKGPAVDSVPWDGEVICARTLICIAMAVIVFNKLNSMGRDDHNYSDGVSVNNQVHSVPNSGFGR